MKSLLMAFVLLASATVFAAPTTSHLFWVSVQPNEVEQRIALWESLCMKKGQGSVLYKKANAEDGSVIFYDIICEKNTRGSL